MKSLLMITAMILSIPAFADSYMECDLSGQSDDLFGTPKSIDLDEASGYRLTINRKEVKGFDLVEKRNSVQVSYTSLKAGNIVESKISFDYSTCEDDSQGTAVYSQTVIGSRGFKAAPAVAIYQCQCGID